VNLSAEGWAHDPRHGETRRYPGEVTHRGQVVGVGGLSNMRSL
jgi:hypothetical protein